MNITIVLFNFISVFYNFISSFTFKLLKPNHHHSETLESHDETGRDNPLENTAQGPANTDAVDHSIEMEMETEHRQSVIAAASSESATVLSHLTRRMQPLPATNRNIQATNDNHQLGKRLYFIVGAYLTAMGISLQAIEILKNLPELSESFQFHYFRMFLVITLVYLTISTFVRPFSVTATFLIEHVAVLFGFLAFTLVITISGFPTEVIKVSLATFVLPLVIVVLAPYLWRH